MISLVVDASVLVACAVADGKTRRAYLSAHDLEFYAPEYVRDELLKRVPKILAISGVAPADLSALLEDLFARLTIVSREGFESRREEARQIVARAQTAGDEDYVALALPLDAPIWTYDKNFLRIPKVRVVTSEQVRSGKVD